MSARFATTSWTVVLRAQAPGAEAQDAIAVLSRQYWQPLWAYARRAGQSAQQAEDTVQDFLVHVLEHDVFSRADARRGRFRTFLLSALQQFLARQHRDGRRLKRAPGTPLLSLDVEHAERTLGSAIPGGASPEEAFERAWALAQLEQSWARIQSEFAEAGKVALFDRLRPIAAGQVVQPVSEVAAGLGMTEGAVNVAVHRLRRRFGEVLRAQIALTVAGDADVDDEIARLRQALANSAG